MSQPVRTAFQGLGIVSRSGAFWLLWGSFLVCGLSTNGLVQTHFITAAHDHGISRNLAAGLLSLVGLFDIVGTLASGYLTDKVDPRRLLFVYYALRGWWIAGACCLVAAVGTQCIHIDGASSSGSGVRRARPVPATAAAG